MSERTWTFGLCSSYGIVEQFLDPGVNVFAFLLSNQQVNIVDAGACAQQLVDQNFAHEALKCDGGEEKSETRSQTQVHRSCD
jgi:hypothetical protein